MTIYRARSADLIRIATDGTGLLPAGEISNDLAERLAAEAATVADQVLTMCIRALDYCPPTDLTFGEYLRAIITADKDIVPNDTSRLPGCLHIGLPRSRHFPAGVRHLAEDSLLWEPPPLESETLELTEALLANLDLRWSLYTDRARARMKNHEMNAEKVWYWLHDRKARAAGSNHGGDGL